jgi:hypothetical protein
LDDLLNTHPVEHRSPYNNLKQLPKRPTRNHLNDLFVHLTWLSTFGEVKPFLSGITAAKIQHFAAEAKALDAGELKQINQPKRITLILCLIYAAQVATRDNLVSMFLKRMGTLHHKAKEELEKIRSARRETTEKLVGVLTSVLQVFVSEPVEGELREQLERVITPNGGVQQLLNECESLNAYAGNNYLPLLWRFYKSHRSAFFRLLSVLRFESTTAEQNLIEALKFLLDNEHRRGEWLPNRVDLSFANARWQKLIINDRGKQTLINRRHFEICVFSYLADELKSGDVCVIGSEEYADYREQLLSWSDVAALSPYMTSHIKRFGDYLLDLKQVPKALDELTAFVL